MKTINLSRRAALTRIALKKWSLLLLLCVISIQMCAKTHYDAGYYKAAWSRLLATDVTILTITDMHIYNYQGDNSHFSSDGKITVYVGEDEHVFYFSEMSSNSESKKNFYYDGEGDENQAKNPRAFPSKFYQETRNNIRIWAYLQDQQNSQPIAEDSAVGYTSGTSDKWCLATLVIRVYTKSPFSVNISATWRDHSDGINNDHEKVDWTFNYYGSASDSEDSDDEIDDAGDTTSEE